jgi:hypothetical protein
MSKARDIASAAPAPSTVSATELGYVDGVTSAIQTQLDAKLTTATASSTYIPKTLTTTTGDIIYASSANTPARLGIGSTSQVLTVSGGVPSWATPTSTSFPAFSAYKDNGNQSIGTATFTKLTFNTEDFDTGGNFASDTFTVGTAGYYQISASSRINTNGTSILSLYKNGTAYHEVYEWTSSAQWNSASLSVLMYLSVNDTLEIYGYSGASGTAGNGRINTWFSAVGIRS